MNTYIIRAKSHGYDYEDEFLNGRVSIGWPCQQDLTNSDREEIREALHQKYGSDQIKETAVSMVQEFMSVPTGSIILNPSISNRALIHILKAAEPCQYDPSRDNDEYGNPHYVKSEFLRTVAREDLPDRVIKSLSGARKTVSNISQHSEVMNQFLATPHANNPDAKQVQRRIPEYKQEAFLVLYNLLDSEKEEVRLQASIALLNLDGF